MRIGVKKSKKLLITHYSRIEPYKPQGLKLSSIPKPAKYSTPSYMDSICDNRLFKTASWRQSKC